MCLRLQVLRRLKKGVPVCTDAPKHRRKAKVCADALVSNAKTLIESNPKLSLREVGEKLGIHRSTAYRVVKERLNLKSVRQVRGIRLGSKQKEYRLKFCRQMIALVKKKELSIDRVFFSDEKIFKICGGGVSTKNNALWIPTQLKKRDIDPALLVKDVGANRKGVMAGQLISKMGVPPPCFVESGVKVSANYYINSMLAAHYLPYMRSLGGTGGTYWFQQDGAPSHSAGDTLKYLNSNKVKIMGGLRWPSRSADLSPLDYGYWAIVDRNIHKNRPDMKTMMDLKSAIIEEAQKMAQNQQLIDKIIDGFLPRMKRVVELEGGFVEPTGQFEV